MRKAVGLAGGLLVACLAANSTGASALAAETAWVPDDTAPTHDAVEAAATRARAERCRTPSCQAIETIDGLLKIVDYIEDNVDMTGRDRIIYSRHVVWRRLRRELLDRPDLYLPFCATSIRLLRRVSPTPDEIVVPVTLLTEGVDVDVRTHGHCAEDMVAALPRSPAIDQVRENAEIGCERPADGHPRPKAACETLVEGLPAAQ